MGSESKEIQNEFIIKAVAGGPFTKIGKWQSFASLFRQELRGIQAERKVCLNCGNKADRLGRCMAMRLGKQCPRPRRRIEVRELDLTFM